MDKKNYDHWLPACQLYIRAHLADLKYEIRSCASTIHKVDLITGKPNTFNSLVTSEELDYLATNGCIYLTLAYELGIDQPMFFLAKYFERIINPNGLLVHQAFCDCYNEHYHARLHYLGASNKPRVDCINLIHGLDGDREHFYSHGFDSYGVSLTRQRGRIMDYRLYRFDYVS